MTDLKAIAKQILSTNSNIIAGVRSVEDDEQYEIGDIARPSYVWDFERGSSTYDLDDVETESYPFTCTTGIKDGQAYFGDADNEDDVEDLANQLQAAIDFNRKLSYEGDTQVILMGEQTSEDLENDPQELDLIDPVVIGIIKK